MRVALSVVRGVDERALRRLRGRAQRLGVVPRHDDLVVLVALLDDAIAFTNRDRRPGLSAESDRHHGDAGLSRPVRGGHDFLLVLERFPVAHNDERAIAGRAARLQQIRALRDRARDRAARLPDDRRVEVVEEEIERAFVHRERREDVAAPREREQREPVAARCRAKPTHFLLEPLEPAGPFVGRQHRQRRIERKHDVDPLAAEDRRLLSPARPGQRDRREQRRQAEPRGAAARQAQGAEAAPAA